MRTSFGSRWRGMGVVMGLGMTLIASSASATSDAWITTKAKIALLTTEGVRSNDVSVDTIDGAVTLHGAVESAAERAKAEDVVTQIDGVRRVQNLLQVRSECSRRAGEASDAQLKTRVERALKADRQLRETDVLVRSVNAGPVLLAGEVKTLDQYLHAIEVASKVSGVKHVASEITSPRIADADDDLTRRP
ncbi:MAG: BON domain-containing protein [Candidatus Binatia bacterium]